MNTREIGNKNEQLAAKFLKKKGYKIIKKNYSNKIGEIDLIVSINEFIVFVEVKSHSTKGVFLPSQKVNFVKQEKIKKVATSYLLTNEIKSFVRFDVIEIIDDEINHIESAFM